MSSIRRYRYIIVKVCVDIVTISTISLQCAGINVDKTLSIVGSALLPSISISFYACWINYIAVDIVDNDTISKRYR